MRPPQRVKNVTESVTKAVEGLRTSLTVVQSPRLRAVTKNINSGSIKSEGKGVNPVKTPTKRARKVKEPPTYIIPPIKRLETTFKGRLGYACLNTVLRNSTPSIFCSRTCRIDTIKKEGMNFLKELGRQNMADLTKLIEWNAAHHIKFFRMSSEMFPFAAHSVYQYSLEYAQEELKEAGETAKRLGVRLTSHPGQFTQLGSPKPVVVENAIRDLNYHCEMMDRMGLDKDSVMIIHGGGVYGDKASALERFKTNFARLSANVQNRLVLENDEMCYNVDDLLPVCEELGIPLVFDYHHDWIYPSTLPYQELMPRILETWEKRGIKPKQHLSEPRKGAETVMEKRAHADRCQRLPEGLPDDMDLMIEAKDKEQAVFHLFRIYDLAETVYEDLRPPVEEETKETLGRKSNKRKMTAVVGDGEGAVTDTNVGEVAIEGSASKRRRSSRAISGVKNYVEKDEEE
ncbi:UV-endonuclease UvdE [Meredithblackwellia eburnea MCA 4105]